MANLTKTEKEYWVRELKEILAGKIEDYDGDVKRCMAIARKKVLEDLGIEKDWNETLNQWAKLEKKLQSLEEEISSINSRIFRMNEAVKRDVVVEETSYDGSRYYSRRGVSISFTFPQLASSKYNRFGISEDWIDHIAKSEYLMDVLADEGCDDLLELYKLRDTIKRNVFLATTTAQMQEFILSFTERLGVEL